MSRKMIPFPVPKRTVSPASSVPEANSPAYGTKADDWVAQPVTPGDGASVQRFSGLTIAISDEPDMFELWKIGVFLPYALAWRWAFGATKRSMRAFAR